MKVTVAGIEREIAWGSLRINRRLGARSTASFDVHHEGVEDIDRLSSVLIEDGATRLFRGFTQPRSKPLSGTNHSRITVTCTDAHSLADWTIVNASYPAQASGTTVAAIITSHLAAKGITAGTIQTGPSFGALEYFQERASDVISKLAADSGFVWWIDPDLALHFVEPGSIDAPFPLDGETALADSVEVDRPDSGYANRIYIRGTDIVANNASEQTRIAAITGGSGIIEAVVDGWHLQDGTSQQEAADNRVADLAQEEIRLKCATRYKGFDVGQTVPVTFTDQRLTAHDMTILSVTIAVDHNDTHRGAVYTIDARSGPVPVSASTKMTRITQRGADIVGAIASTGAFTDIQSFTAAASYTIPDTTWTLGYLVGGGGGGGSGSRGPAGTDRGGGGGGSAGSALLFLCRTESLGNPGDTVTLSGFTGGAGGAAISTDNTDGDAGQPGSNTVFGDYRALGGAAGAGGSGSGSVAAGGTAKTSCLLFLLTVTAGAGGDGDYTAPTDGSVGTGLAPSGGGGGGGIDAANNSSTGGDGGALHGTQAGLVSPTLGGAVGAAGEVADLLALLAGTGGGGGGVAGEAGGDGGDGAGGGGGHASANGSASGAGGDGGTGFAVIMGW